MCLRPTTIAVECINKYSTSPNNSINGIFVSAYCQTIIVWGKTKAKITAFSPIIQYGPSRIVPVTTFNVRVIFKVLKSNRIIRSIFNRNDKIIAVKADVFNS